MQTIALINGISRAAAPTGLFEDLNKIYPEGDRQTLFEVKLPIEDPRVDEILDILARYEYKSVGPFGGFSERYYVLALRRIYDDIDITTAPWVAMYPHGGYLYNSEFERLSSGILKVVPHSLPKAIDIAFPNRKWVIISDALKQSLEQQNFEHMVVLPTQARSTKKTGGTQAWELTSDFLLPSVAPNTIFRDVSGNPWNADSVGHRLLLQEPYENYELHYTERAFASAGTFDVAVTAENINRRDRGDLIVSQRFYRFCRDLNLDIEWVPVRIDEDEPGAISEPVWAPQRIEVMPVNTATPAVDEPAFTLEAALDKLREFKIRFPEQFDPPAAQSAIDDAAARIGLPIPSAWQEVLKIANAFEIYKCVLDGDRDGIMFHPAEEMAAEHNSLMQSLLSGNSHFAPHYLLIANNYSGDMIGLDTSAIDESGDCPVALISHGAYGVSYEWGSIAEFLMNILVEPSREDDEK